MIGSFKKYAKYNGKEYLITTVGTEVRINTQKTDNTDEQFKPCKANNFLDESEPRPSNYTKNSFWDLCRTFIDNKYNLLFL